MDKSLTMCVFDNTGLLVSWWKNILKITYDDGELLNDDDLYRLLQKYNAKFCLDKFNVSFESKEDLTEFLLTWG